jgi:hypothetical protein
MEKIKEKAYLAAQALIEWMSKNNIAFKVYNLGAGVKRITSDTDICPCCKKNFRERRKEI